MYGYIYKTTDRKTNKIYVGKHHSNVFEGYDYLGSGLIISNIKNKLLENNISFKDRFDIEMIDTAESLKELNEKEIYWINQLDARNPSIGYNICKGGESGPGGPMMLGHKHSEETKQKMRKSRSGSQNSNYGNRWHQSDELRFLHSQLSSGSNNGMYGRNHSTESKQKNKLSHLGKYAISNEELDLVIMVTKEESVKYLNSGWIKGNIHCKKNYKERATTIESVSEEKNF